MRVWVKTEDVLAMVAVLIFLLNFETILTDGKMNNIIILQLQLQLQLQKPCAFLQSIQEFKLATTFCHKSEKLVFKQDDFFP